jgi:hypothetical protein
MNTIKFFLLVAILGATPLYSHAFSTITSDSELLSGLISYWPMDESGGSRLDVIGLNNLSDANNVGGTEGVVGGAANLSQQEYQYLHINDGVQEGLEPSQISLSMWVRTPADIAHVDDVTMIAKRSYEGGYAVSLQDWGQMWWQINDEHMCTNITRCGGTVITTYDHIDDGAWHHVVTTYDGQTGKIYIDGDLAAYKEWGTLVLNTNDPFYVGQILDSHYLEGALDEVGVWNRALTDEEVSRLYNNGSGLPYGEETSHSTSSVAFIPGIMGSRLYMGDTEGGESQKWETANARDLATLRMNTDGSSVYSLYTRDIIDSIRPLTGLGSHLTFGDAYGEWIEFMDNLVNEGAIPEWKTLPYDWRLGTDILVHKGKELGEENISYTETPDGIPYLIAQLQGLASRSPSGKITIIAHSNGGLIAKNLVHYLEQTEDPLLEKIDAVVLVASPQAGTPKAVRELLHGMDMPGQQTLRDILQYMPGAYGLLPSRQYMTLNSAESVVEFDTSVEDSPVLKDLAGFEITTYEDLRAFLIGTTGIRDGVATLGYKHPNKLDATILDEASAMHETIDPWSAPSNIRMVEVVGSGLWTPRGVRYSGVPERMQSGSQITKLRTEWLANTQGDGTVRSLSAESGKADETYYFGMSEYNGDAETNYAHGTILSAPPVQELIRDNVLGESDEIPIYMNETGAIASFPRFEMRAYSPADIHLHQGDKHTGVTDEMKTDLGQYYDLELINSYYEEWTDVKYIGADFSNGDVEVRVVGTGEGVFTLVLDVYDGDTKTDTYTWTDIPVLPNSRGTMTIDDGAPVLTYDYDGDGEVDAELESGDPFNPNPNPVTFSGLRQAIRDANMPAKLRVWLLARVDLAETLYAKGVKGTTVATGEMLKTLLAMLGKNSNLIPGGSLTRIQSLATALLAGL